MDSQVLASIAIAVSILGTVYTAVNHTRVRSVCCGKKIEVSLDVEKTTPTPSAPVL